MSQAVHWDPDQYLRFADHRDRPFYDLVSRVGAAEPASVVDLGCGPGTLTAGLLDRWPSAVIEGIDSSPEMIVRAQPLAVPDRLTFGVGDVREWQPSSPVDVIVSNALFQWVPGHLGLLASLVRKIKTGGWLAFQLPGNFGAPSHALMREVAADPRWASYFDGSEIRAAAHDPADYLGALDAAGCGHVDVWETTYFQVLHGEDPVFEWVKGTGLRPYLQALPSSEVDGFTTVYKERLREAYPAREFGTVLPFRRIFAIAQKGNA